MNLLSSIQLQDRAQFERNVSWALLGGAAGGLFSAVASGSRLQSFFLWAVAAGTVWAFARGDATERWVLRVLGVLFPIALLALPGDWGNAAAGAGAGLLLVVSSVACRGKEGRVAQYRPSGLAYAAGAAVGAGLLVIGHGAAEILSVALRQGGLHWTLATTLAGTVTALFLSFAALPAHVLVEADPVEAKAMELRYSLDGDLGEVCSRMLASYRRCGELLAQLPRDAARAELADVTSHSVNDALDLAKDWQSVEAQLEESSNADVLKELAALRQDAERTKDEVAKRQLLMAAESLSEEVARLDQLGARRERVMARLKATCAELDRTRLSLLSLRSARSHTKATELLVLSRKLKSLSALESTRGELESAVATGAELAHVESAAAKA